MIRIAVLAAMAVALTAAGPASAWPSGAAAARISGAIDPSVRQLLPNDVPAASAGGTDLGRVPDSFALPHMTLVLKSSAAQMQSLKTLTAAQQNPASPLYHHWLTTAQYRQAFAPAAADIDRLTSWLGRQGFVVNAVAGSGLSIDFTGTAGLVRQTFATGIHAVSMRSGTHISNIGDPSIPAALAPVVAGIASLNDFRPHPVMHAVGAVRHAAGGGWKLSPAASSAHSGTARPNLTFASSGTYYDVSPADFATIYDVGPLRTAATPLTGAGETVAVLELSDMQTVDWISFRNQFGLSPYGGSLNSVQPGGCADPGTNDAEGEAALDAEWVGAAAPAAAVVVASCSDSATTDGLTLALTGEVNAASPPAVISISYGQCETSLGASFVLNWSQLMQQAAAEGISVFVSSGDSASAGCDDDSAMAATGGLAVNGLATTAYAVAVGGTDFADTLMGSDADYWSAANASGGGSALSYVPEVPWNNSCAGALLAAAEGASSGLAFCNSQAGQDFLDIVGGSGGASTIVAKPAWQATTIAGVPDDGVRDIPDVALFAGNGLYGHALLYCMSDTTEGGSACSYDSGSDDLALSAGGTSFAAPAFAGIMALIDQKNAALQGNPAPRLYALAAAEYGNASVTSACNASLGNTVGGSCVFHNVTAGDNDVPCQPGSTNCYTSDWSQQIGVLLQPSGLPAYPAQAGWSATAGLGSVDVNNLVAGF